MAGQSLHYSSPSCTLQHVLVLSPLQMLQGPHQMLGGTETFEPLNEDQRREMVTRGVQVKPQAAACLRLPSAWIKGIQHHILLAQGAVPSSHGARGMGHPSSSQVVLAA